MRKSGIVPVESQNVHKACEPTANGTYSRWFVGGGLCTLLLCITLTLSFSLTIPRLVATRLVRIYISRSIVNAPTKGSEIRFVDLLKGRLIQAIFVFKDLSRHFPSYHPQHIECRFNSCYTLKVFKPKYESTTNYYFLKYYLVHSSAL